MDIDAQAVTPGEWQCGVRRLAVANGPNIFQMLLVSLFSCIVSLLPFTVNKDEYN